MCQWLLMRPDNNNKKKGKTERKWPTGGLFSHQNTCLLLDEWMRAYYFTSGANEWVVLSTGTSILRRAADHPLHSFKYSASFHTLIGVNRIDSAHFVGINPALKPERTTANVTDPAVVQKPVYVLNIKLLIISIVQEGVSSPCLKNWAGNIVNPSPDESSVQAVLHCWFHRAFKYLLILRKPNRIALCWTLLMCRACSRCSSCAFLSMPTKLHKKDNCTDRPILDLYSAVSFITVKWLVSFVLIYGFVFHKTFSLVLLVLTSEYAVESLWIESSVSLLVPQLYWFTT